MNPGVTREMLVHYQKKKKKKFEIDTVGLWLWCLTPLSTIFQIYLGSVILVEDSAVPRETTDLSQVTEKLYHIILYREHFAMSGF